MLHPEFGVVSKIVLEFWHTVAPASEKIASVSILLCKFLKNIKSLTASKLTA